ncbi:MATH domain and coiled-coil domain-containing protein At3g58250-like isoform X2 [Euphorbia lathyris]
MFCFCFNNSVDSAQKTKEQAAIKHPIPQLPAQHKQTDSAKKTKEQQIRYLPAVDEQTEVIRELRDLPPVHYLFKIQNFSHLLNAKRQSFQSSDFVVAGYTWRLRLSHYPKGNKNLMNEKQYLSLYLRLLESSSLPKDKEIDVFFQLFVYNQVQDNYLTVQGRVRRFRGIKSECGFDELLPLDIFKDESNGYLIKDRCVFGAEIFVLDFRNIRRGESVSVVKELGDNSFTWNIQNFEKMKEVHYKSEVFAIGGHK